jgi:hypothetical protein
VDQSCHLARIAVQRVTGESINKLGIDNLHNQEESVLSRINEEFSRATKTIHYEMVRCPICGKKWLDTADNAQCIREYGCCLCCRYKPSCVTVEHEIEAGLDAGNEI